MLFTWTTYLSEPCWPVQKVLSSLRPDCTPWRQFRHSHRQFNQSTSSPNPMLLVDFLEKLPTSSQPRSWNSCTTAALILTKLSFSPPFPSQIAAWEIWSIILYLLRNFADPRKALQIVRYYILVNTKAELLKLRKPFDRVYAVSEV